MWHGIRLFAGVSFIFVLHSFFEQEGEGQEKDVRAHQGIPNLQLHRVNYRYGIRIQTMWCRRMLQYSMRMAQYGRLASPNISPRLISPYLASLHLISPLLTTTPRPAPPRQRAAWEHAEAHAARDRVQD
jgi:hypothetical protein